MHNYLLLIWKCIKFFRDQGLRPSEKSEESKVRIFVTQVQVMWLECKLPIKQRNNGLLGTETHNWVLKMYNFHPTSKCFLTAFRQLHLHHYKKYSKGQIVVTHRSIDIHDHLATRSVPLTMVSSFLFLLEYSLSCGSVLQCKLTNDFTEPVNAYLMNSRCWVSKKQQEHVEPAGKWIYKKMSIGFG